MQNPFHSFWWAGFECADHLNAFGNRVDFLQLTGHLKHRESDYAMLEPHDLRTVREGIRWSQVERRPHWYDWQDVHRLLHAGHARGIQQVWDLCHFGYPDDLTPLHPHFTDRFVRLCRAFVTFYRERRPEGPLLVTPMVEVSFISWLGGDACGTSPYTHGQGWAVKYALMRAYIAGVAAMKEMDKQVIIVASEPLSYVAPRYSSFDHPDATQNRLDVEAHNQLQYEAMDMLTGRRCPELGGRPEYLDVLGLNHYENSQREWGGGVLTWYPNDERRLPLDLLVSWAHERYQVPIVITETGHWGDAGRRAQWIAEVGAACQRLLTLTDVPLWGCCLYPVLDRIDWDHTDEPCHRPGLFDALDPWQPAGERVPCLPALEALHQAQQLLDVTQPSI